MAEPTIVGASARASAPGAASPADLARSSAVGVGSDDSSAGTDDTVGSALSLLDDVDMLPLTDQVTVYEAVHAALRSALTDEPG